MSILEEFGRLKRRLNLGITKELSGLKIGPKQALVLRNISKLRSCSQMELANATLTDPAAIGRGIESLKRQGWITRKSHPTDSRRWTIKLSSKGQRNMENLESSVSRLADCFVENFSQKEKEDFLRLLQKASTNFEVYEGLEN